MADQTALMPLSLQGFVQLPPRQKLLTIAGVAFVVAVLAGAWMWSRTPAYSVLFSNVSDKDGGAIIAALQQQNVPFRFTEGGSAILVPSDKVHEARLRLASQGLPRGGSVGFELMDTQKLGISQFAEQLNYQRGLEGELARSVESLAAVKGARVHLAIPKQTGFLRDEQKPSASVLLGLHAGRRLDPAQIAGIVHLVSSSVPQLSPGSVSVIDQNGNLLSAQADPARAAGLDPTQLKYVEELEQSYVKRIEAILAPIVGAGNLRAQVTAEVDFSHTEQTAETFRPNQNPAESAVRSQQTSEALTREPGAAGVPGALSNQPPVPAIAPITSPPAPGTPIGSATTGFASSAGTAPVNTRRDSTVNYEVDKTIRHTRQAVGTVKRLSAAVVVNHKREPGAEGAPPTTRPYGEAELKQMQDLVREAMGFNKERGDTLSVANTPFNPAEREAVPEIPFWRNPEVINLAKELGRYLVFGAIAAWLFFGVVRPLIRTLATRAEQAIEATALEPAAALPGAAEPPAFDRKLSGARELAKQDPKLVAGVIKGWVGTNER